MNDRDLLTDPRRGCAPGKVNPDIFFGVTTGGDAEDAPHASFHAALRICNRTCPDDIRDACDRYATDTRQKFGVWGGKVRSAKRNKADRQDTEPEPAPEPEPQPPADPARQRRDRLDAYVKQMHARGVDDQIIAFAMGVAPKTVAASRRRQKLPTLYGPGGRRLQHTGQVTA